MKILVVNGSPHTHGGTATLLNAVVAGLGDRHQVEWINVNALQMASCTGCLKCRPHGTCVLPEDDAHRLAVKLEQADAFVVGSPTFWATIPAPLKMLFDRTVPVFMHEVPNGFPVPHLKGKRAVIIATCNTPWPINILMNQSRGVVKMLRAVFRFAGAKVVGTLERGDMRDKPELTARELAKAQDLGRRLVA